MVVKDVPWDFDSLDPLFQKVKLPEPIQNVLPRCIESALKSDVSYEVRSAAVSLLRRLIENGDYHGDLLNKANDGTIVTRLADICIKDDDGDLRKETLRLLKSIFDNQRFQDAIKASLSKVIEAAMKDPESAKYRPNAIEAIRSLTDSNADDQYDRFKEIVSPSISPLMKMTLLVTDKDHENLRKQAEDILLDNLTASTTETKLNRDVLTMIPTMIPTITVEGKGIALQLAEGLVISDDTAASIAHALAPILRNASSFARATAIELLSRIYSRHRQSKPRLIESAIPEIITLALDDKDDVGGIRATAIRLLVALSGASADTKDSEHNSTLSYSTSGPVLKQITPLATKFMTLLDNENLRPSVVELLSLMSTEAAVRKTISLQIITLAFGPESLALVGHAELLARLISDGRFADEPTDHVMLFLASAMVTRPKLAPQRYQILTALWCRYGSKALAYDADAKFLKNKELVDWFTFALFGRHATIHEVPTWTARSGIWLPVTVVPPTPEPTPLAASEI
ncbi:armadillo-type protein [Ephemerocybe angulata]|uniref:Armadillo-type protein n=1 Tax=Ephemerocybe angulata TaxID=980116 RepID=A0A8H6IGI9_9AGAR|nr:armadillo-type protein [Tulosesus angulatus]